MTGHKEAHSVLIISPSDDIRRQVSNLLDPRMFGAVTVGRNAEEARRLILHNHYDLVVVDSPLQGSVASELALDIAEKCGSALLMLTPLSSYDDVRYRVEAYGVMTLPKPLDEDMIRTAITISMASYNRMLAMEEENRKLRFKNEELRLCNRAKWALHENLGMDEPTAHRYIEKTAMNNRMTRYAVAKEILKEFE